MATEKELRNTIATWGNAYKGISEGSTKHKELINIFNNSGLCSRYKMTVNDAWCAMFVSDAFIANNLTSIFPCVECGCANMITLAKNNGIWVENDAYVPGIGDVILYDWQDSGSGDNTGTPDHVGIVQSISGSSFVVIEGNKSDTVGTRSMTVNGKYIRGYITPNYAKAASGGSSSSGSGSGTSGSGSGSGTSSGTSGSSKTVDSSKYGPDDSVAGTYTVTASSGLNIRYGIDKDVIVAIPKGTEVRCYGYYNKKNDVKWLYVQFVYNGYEYTGYASSEYLQKKSGSSSSGSSGSGSSGSSLPTYTVGKTYTTQVDHLAVRSSAEVKTSNKKTKSQLTSDGQNHAYSDGCLKKGTSVTCKATKTVNGDVWMQIPSGWIAAYYGGSKYVK